MTKEDAEEEILSVLQSLDISQSEARRLTRSLMTKVRSKIREAPEPDYTIAEVGDEEIRVRMKGGNKTQAQTRVDEHTDQQSIPGTWKIEEEKEKKRTDVKVYIAKKQPPPSSSTDSSSSDSLLDQFEDLSSEEQMEFLEEHAG